MKKTLTQTYNPLYFLSALGNGGLAVSFYIYLMFMIKHPDTPMTTFNHIYKVFMGGDIIAIASTTVALLGIIFFAIKHFILLVWNIKEYAQFKKTESFTKLKSTNAEITLMALPLTYAMSGV